MTEANIYQKALTNAIEQAANSQIAVREHLRRLAFMKSERIYEACIGNEYQSRALGTVKAVAVGYEIKENVFELTRYNTTRNAIIIKIVFAADVQALLDSKRKQLTDAERKGLKEMQDIRRNADYSKKNLWYRPYTGDPEGKVTRFENMDSAFRNRKNALKVLEIVTWYWSLSAVMKDDFMERGLNYDGQSIVWSKDKDK